MAEALEMVLDEGARAAPVNRFEAILQNKKSSKAAAEAVEETEQLRASKPTGLARELMDLIGGRPPVVASAGGIQSAVVRKADLGKHTRVRPWRWASFTNPARGDTFALSHWARVEDIEAQPPKEYPFAKFNKKITVPQYTIEEYTRYLMDPSFSEEETKLLLELCQRYDLRFIIVQDRFTAEGLAKNPPWTKRSVEDLKARYYHVVKRLAEIRDLPADSIERSFVYDKKHEVLRKLQLKKLNSRTYAQVAEEAYLRGELKRIRARQKEQGINTGDNDGYSSDGSVARKGTKRKAGRARSESMSAGDEGGEATERGLQAGVHLRSQLMQKQMALVKPKIAQYVTKTCDELKIGNPLPTARIAGVYTEVRDNLIELANVQQQIQARQYELIALREKHAELLKKHGIAEAAASEAGPASAVKRTISASLLPTAGLEAAADLKKAKSEEAAL